MQVAQEVIKIDADAIERFSKSGNEPGWLTKFRLDSFKKFESILLPLPYYTNYSKIDAELRKPKEDKRNSNNKIKEIQNDNYYSIIINNAEVQENISDELKVRGVIFTSITNAIKDNGELIKKYFNLNDNRFACLNDALFNSGIFLYVPKNTGITIPFRLIFYISNQGIRVFSKTIIILDEGSSINFLEEKYSDEFNSKEKSICSDNMEVYVGRNAVFNIITLQNFNENIYNSSNRKAFINGDAKANWNQAFIGSGFSTTNLNNYLNEQGATSEDVQVYFGRGNQHFDITSNIVNNKPNTKGNIFVKGVLKENARSVFQGLIKISPKAQLSDSFLAAHAMLLNPGARADSIPSLEIEANDVKASHASSVAQIDEEQIFYLKSRGLNESTVKKMLIFGFLEQATYKINDPKVREKIVNMIEEKFEAIRWM